jgi:hypothetical protein
LSNLTSQPGFTKKEVMTKQERSSSQEEMFSLVYRWQESGISQIDFFQQQ